MSFIHQNETPPSVAATAGSLSGLFVRSIIAPIDILKIRLQLQLTPQQYNSIIGTASDIYRNEGLGAFWKGNVPASIMYIAYGGVQFSAFTAISNSINYTGEYTSLLNTGIGMCSGCIAMLATYPLDLLRTRLASNKNHNFASMTQTVISIYNTKKLNGLFIGSKLSLYYVSLTTGLSFGVYSELNSYHHLFPFDIKPIAGLVAGIVSKTITYPLDLLKRRMQMNYSDTFTHIIKSQGVRGLYRGLIPAIIKSAPTTGLTLFFYEKFISIYNTF